MGYLFEHLIRKFNEQANEEAGDHFTPREVIRLMAHLLYTEDEDVYSPGISRTIYDPACERAGCSRSQRNTSESTTRQRINSFRSGLQSGSLCNLLLRHAYQR